MKVLLSAYACGPGIGSEPEVGLRVLEAAARRHEVWVLTQPHMAAALRALLPPDQGARVMAVGEDAPREQAGLRALMRTATSHDRWQREAAAIAARLHDQVGFDVVHHATLAAYWMRTGVARLPVPLVWGPVGGAVEPPLGLLPVLGTRGAVEDFVRAVVRLLAWTLPGVRRTVSTASVVLAQNDATARRLRSARDLSVLPNALCGSIPAVSATGPRRRDVAVVGRVVAWKAVPLAVRTMAHVPDAVLRVYGYATDTESARVLHAARRYGVADRVEMLGAMPREQLLERVATSGVVLHPSLHDEASFTVAEARALGTPIVALRHGGPPHVAAAWAPAGAQFVRPSTPGRTAHALGRAVRAALDEPPPVLTRGVPPRIDFAQHVLAAYERAARSTAS